MKVRIFSENMHWTKVHNLVFDIVLPRLSPNAFKVLMFFVRQITGHARRNFSASYSDISAGAGKGLKSRGAVSAALHELLALDSQDKATIDSLLIRQVGEGPKDPFRYALNPRYSVEITFQMREAQADEKAPKRGTGCEQQSLFDEESRSSENEPSTSTENELQKSAPIRTACGSFRRTDEELVAPTEQDAREAIPSIKKPGKGPPQVNPHSDDMPVTHPLFVAVSGACKVTVSRMSVRMRRRIQTVARAFLRDSIPVEQIGLAAAQWPMPLSPVPEQFLDRFDALLAAALAQPPTPAPNRSGANPYPNAYTQGTPHHDTSFFNSNSPRRPIPSAAERRAEKWEEWF